MKYCKTGLLIRAWVHQPLRSGYKMGPFSTKRFHTGHNQVHYWTKTQYFASLHQQERYCMHDKFQHQHFKRILNMETLVKKVSNTMVKKVSNTFWRILTVMGGPFYGRCFLPNSCLGAHLEKDPQGPEYSKKKFRI